MRAALALLLLAGCQRQAVNGEESAGECTAGSAVETLVGRTADPALVAEARLLAGARTVRRIEPDTAVTMDYRTDRLNVHVDRAGKVERVNCG